MRGQEAVQFSLEEGVARLSAVRVDNGAARVTRSPATDVVHLALDDQPAVLRGGVACNLADREPGSGSSVTPAAFNFGR